MTMRGLHYFQHFCKEQELTEWLRSHRRTRATDKLARPK
ncbi:hypothetical protein BUH_2611 [Burkholderia pseudomallei Pakistan 9]|nr:hypothetical protein BUH_2611 [Burkholderia pseudomallei Pakistan 9]